MMKSEGLFEWQGGPIILAQVENEYGPMESVMGGGAKPYASWAAKMAVATGAGVPWVMCKQDDAPDPVVKKTLASLFFNRSTVCDCVAFPFPRWLIRLMYRPINPSRSWLRRANQPPRSLSLSHSRRR